MDKVELYRKQLRKVRAQRDAEHLARVGEYAEWQRLCTNLNMISAHQGRHIVALQVETKELRAELAQADAARVVALQVAEAAQKRAALYERKSKQSDDMAAAIAEWLEAENDYTGAEMNGRLKVWHCTRTVQARETLRRLLAAHKAQERAS